MPEVPLLRPSQEVKAFERLGWEVARRRGSHVILVRRGHAATLSLPQHAEVARGTLRGLIQKAGISLAEFLDALGE